MSFDPANRELCPDGSCIGVIGPDGTCNECGAVAPSAHTHSRLRGMNLPTDEADDEPPFESDRELCPDGSCIGVIGPDGRCRECGRRAEGSPSRDDDDRDDDDIEDDRDDDGSADTEGAARAPSDDYDPDDIDRRELCPDGSCIGVIGPDGRCRECGKAAE